MPSPRECPNPEIELGSPTFFFTSLAARKVWRLPTLQIKPVTKIQKYISPGQTKNQTTPNALINNTFEFLHSNSCFNVYHHKVIS